MTKLEKALLRLLVIFLQMYLMYGVRTFAHDNYVDRFRERILEVSSGIEES